MANLNKVHLIGNITRDLELRYTTNGTAVLEIGLATNRRRKDTEGNFIDETTFIELTAWGKAAENTAKFMSKGRSIYVEGRLNLEQWTDKTTGKKMSRLKVVAENIQFLSAGAREKPAEPKPPKTPEPFNETGDEDDIPF